MTRNILLAESDSARAKWNLSRITALTATIVALTMMMYHFVTAGVGTIDPFKHRSLHLTFALVLAFLWYPPKSRRRAGTNWWDVTLALLSMVPFVSLWLNYQRILYRMLYVDPIPLLDHITSVLLLVLVCEATRRVIGMPMVYVALVSIVYVFLGPWLPTFIGHRGITWDVFIEHQVLSMNGVFSVPIAVSSTYVVIFILFGALLVASGVGRSLIDFSKAIAGNTRGGPAKIAVISSALFGTINGSSVANVVSTGSFTIPLMKGIGYRPYFAGAVEAVASTGGQIMPPVMGAAAFVMAEITGISYLTIIKAAAIPAILYYTALMFMVHLEAARTDLPILPRETWGMVGRSVIRMTPLILPVGALLYLLVDGFSPIFAGFWATVGLVVVAQLRKGTRLNLTKLIDGLTMAGRNATVIAITCAAAGIIIGVVTVLGTGIKFTSIVFSLSYGVLFFALVLVMVAALILGMGLPTTASYIIAASVTGPPLLAMGLPMLTAHLFIFYFACISSITPPVAVAAYAAAGLADANPSLVGWTAVRLGVSGFVIPFVFVYWPALLVVGQPWLDALIAVVPAFFGVAALSVACIGWLYHDLNILVRLIYFVAAVLMLIPGLVTDAIGAVMAIAMTLYLRRGVSLKAPETKEISVEPIRVDDDLYRDLG